METNFPNWDHQMDPNAHFDSALSSMVSSPSNPPPPVSDNGVIRELIGRLGSICNSDEVPYLNCNSNNTSCYTTPLSSPPKMGLSWGNPPPAPPATAHLDPGFAERAARFSCFGGRTGFVLESGKLSRVSSCKSMKSGIAESGEDVGLQLEMDVRAKFRSPTPECGEFGGGREESLVSDRVGNARKRKAGPKGKAKEPIKPLDGDLNGKKSKSSETKVEQNSGGENSDGGKENGSKAPEPPKQDFIHVRARRGQATDSHSLAERVRREKISERMKFLQDLVPGCNKVTGKAIMLDEIINYVQSLQRQVEFLSMKLTVVNPRLDLNMENLMQKDMHSSLPHPVFPVEASGPTFQFSQQPWHSHSGVTNRMQSNCTVNPLDASPRRSMHMQLPSLDGFGDATSMGGNLWEDDLQSFVQMGFGQNQEGAFSSQPFQGSLPTAHMKIEL